MIGTSRYAWIEKCHFSYTDDIIGRERLPYVGGLCSVQTANVLFSPALAKKLKSKGIQSYSVHPGGKEALQRR